MKVLNLYAGIGGNRKLWTDVEVTAVELNSEIAKIYQDFFPNDTVIVADAHQYLLDHYKEFDFIWSSPPCPTHSRARYWGSFGVNRILLYPDMQLYQEILFLTHYCKTQWVVENVKPYYEPLIKPIKCGRHLFWTNFKINEKYFDTTFNVDDSYGELERKNNIEIKNLKVDFDKRQILRNMVNPDLGLYILEQARGIIREENVTQVKLAI